MSNLKNIVLIFQENPIARSYLKLFIDENLTSNKIIYLNTKHTFNIFFNKYNFYRNFHNVKKYLKSDNVLKFIKNVENYFKLNENFLIEMYNFDNIYKFKNISYAKSSDINDDKNIQFFKYHTDQNFLNTDKKIFKKIFDTDKNFYHIHPGYLKKVRGADATLHSIDKFNEIGLLF